MDEPFSVCPYCNAEYRPGTERCAACQEKLVEPTDSSAAFDPSEAELVGLAEATDVATARRILAILDAAEIAYFLEQADNRAITDVGMVRWYTHPIWVLPQDQSIATQLLAVADADRSLAPQEVVTIAKASDMVFIEADPFVPDFDVPDTVPPERPASVTHRMIPHLILAMVTGLVALYQFGVAALTSAGPGRWLAVLGWTLLAFAFLWKSRRIDREWRAGIDDYPSDIG